MSGSWLYKVIQRTTIGENSDAALVLQPIAEIVPGIPKEVPEGEQKKTETNEVLGLDIHDTF